MHKALGSISSNIPPHQKKRDGKNRAKNRMATGMAVEGTYGTKQVIVVPKTQNNQENITK
jgi:hypothetical protein